MPVEQDIPAKFPPMTLVITPAGWKNPLRRRVAVREAKVL